MSHYILCLWFLDGVFLGYLVTVYNSKSRRELQINGAHLLVCIFGGRSRRVCLYDNSGKVKKSGDLEVCVLTYIEYMLE